MRLGNKTAIITGGGTGIGKSTALLFAKEGAKVVITDINEEAGKNTIDEIEQLGGEALFVRHDVSNEEDWIQVVKQTTDRFNKVDVLFNNAGIYLIKPLAEITIDEWNRLMAINVTGVFLGMKHVMPLMAQKGKGSVINASSVAGLAGAPGHLLYGASKGAVRIMSKDAAMEYGAAGVRVNSIHPGYIDTGMLNVVTEATNASKAELGNLFPLENRLGKVEEIANLVLFLASDESSYCTGSEFVADGGFSAQ
ncbi:glucose 1-dehydrogenase [Neobacillus drentensis]|uniref:SDR family NAD(P)-dependent oxidoreductase n=1 Tax=Neobacillus drentensis TaxID=220684 RepID=UPI003001AFC8